MILGCLSAGCLVRRRLPGKAGRELAGAAGGLLAGFALVGFEPGDEWKSAWGV